MKPYSSQIWIIPTINWHRAQLAIVDKSYLPWNSKIVSDVTAPLLMTRGIERTFSRPFSETFRISKNEDFNGPYLENKNEFLKNSFETVFRASKSCDRGQLVSAFQLTFKIWTFIYRFKASGLEISNIITFAKYSNFAKIWAKTDFTKFLKVFIKSNLCWVKIRCYQYYSSPLSNLVLTYFQTA